MIKPLELILKTTTLSEAQCQIIENAFVPCKFKAGSDIINAGQSRVNELYFVESGCLRLYSLDETGASHNLQFATENHWITDLNAMESGQAALFGLSCLEDSSLWKVSKSQLEEWYLAVPSLEHFFRVLIQKAYQASLIRMQMQLQGSAARRYEYFCTKFPQWVDRIPQYHIASFIGIQPQSLSRLKSSIS